MWAILAALISTLSFDFKIIVDLLIAVVGDIGQFVAKVLHAVEGVLKGIFVDAVLFCDLGGLVGALTKRIPDGVRGDSLLPDEGSCDGVLQRVVKLRKIRLDRTAISNSIIKSGHRYDTHPLRANQ